MKKIALLIIVCIPYLMNAQNVKLGILLNPQISWLSPAGTDNVTKEGTKFGFDIGLSVEKYFTDNYAFLTGISLNNMGGSISYKDSVILKINEEEVEVANDSEMNFSLQYVKIPIGLKFKTKEIGYFTYFAQIGLEAGVNVKANVSIDNNDIESKKVSEEIQIINAGYLIGGGAEYSIGGNTCIVIGIQYQNGFMDIMKTTNDKIISPKVTFLLGIMF